jgi:hypothetical protein
MKHEIDSCHMRSSFWIAGLSATLGVIAAVVSMGARAEDVPAKPTIAEIRGLERRVKLPSQATALRTYVRYYYALGDSEAGGRSIEGVYIAKALFLPSENPLADIVVINEEADVAVPAGAKCGVLFVTYNPSSKTAVAACSASLTLEK